MKNHMAKLSIVYEIALELIQDQKRMEGRNLILKIFL